MSHRTPPQQDLGRPERLLCRILLKLYPREFRDEFRDQWLEFISHQWAEETYHGTPLGRVQFWIDVTRDMVVSLHRIRDDSRTAARQNTAVRGGGSTFESLAQDLRFALRTLLRRPLYAGVAVLTLGLGIGAATAMFSVVDGVLLADTQFQDPDRLMTIWQRLEGRGGYTDAGETRLQYHQYRALQEQSTVFQEVAVYAADWGESSLGGGTRPELVNVGPTTASLLPVLGVRPVLGRWFLPEEEGADAGDRASVTVMSHEMWIRRFAGDRDVLGQSVLINGRPFTVIGILPPRFRLQWLTASITGARDPGPRDFWVPVGAPEWGEAPGSTMWEAVGRLAPGVTVEQAQVETSRILAEAWPRWDPSAMIVPRTAEEIRGLSSPILLLFGATGFLLLIACGNVAALSLGEMDGRTQEVATRAALGAGWPRITRQLMTESVVLGLMGSTLGALLAVGGTKLLVALAPPIPRIDQVQVDFLVLAFAALAGTLSGLLFGLAPAFLAARKAVGSTLRSGSRSGSRHRARLGRGVLAGEIALTVMLLVASGLLARSLSRLLTVELGFDPRNVATVEVGLPDARYGWELDGAAWGFADEVLREMEAIPGVSNVSASSQLPFPDSPAEWAAYANREDSTYLMPELFNVAPGYLDFMGIPVLEGRGLLSSDEIGGPPVAVVSHSLARALWGDRSAVGQEMLYPMGPVTVVGVAGDTRQASLQEEPPLTFYVPFDQHPRSEITFAARTRGPAQDVLSSMREAVWRVDGELAITASGSLEESILDTAAEERYRTLLMTLFAFMAAVLAAVGIGGVTARQISQQTRELGIRKALGARDEALLGQVVRGAGFTGALGVGMGLAGAFLLRHLLAAFLFGVEPFDILTYGGIGALFLTLTLAASYLPARRLLRLDPVAVLKEE